MGTLALIDPTGERRHTTPPGEWYDQAEAEWVMLVAGEAGVLFEGGPAPRNLTPGDWLTIGPHVRHRVECTAAEQDTIWLAIHYRA